MNKEKAAFLKDCRSQGYDLSNIEEIYDYMMEVFSLHPDDFEDECGSFDNQHMQYLLEEKFPETLDFANDIYTYADELSLTFMFLVCESDEGDWRIKA